MSLDIDAYLARIGYDGPRAPTLPVLRALQRLHPAAIAFENLDARFGVTPKLDIASVQAKLVRQKRGGYCFEQNALYQAALDALGFQTRALIGRVRWRQPETAPETGRTHRLILVTVDGEDWITDVGFGGLVLTAPLKLEAEVAQETPHETFRLVRRGAGFEQQALLGGTWSPTYRFDLEPAPAIDFEIGNWFCATSPQSHFTFTINVSRAPSDGRLTLLDTDFGRRGLDGVVQRRRLETADALAEVLRTEFLLEPPAYADLDAVIRGLQGIDAGRQDREPDSELWSFQMSKYKALSDFLADHGGDSWTVSFDHLESLLGISLPKTAREKASWWENSAEPPKPHAKAWLEQGFRTSALDMAGGEVTFMRHRAVGEAAPEPVREPDPTAHEVMAAAEAVYERDKAAAKAKKVGVVAAALGVLGGVGLVALRLIGKRK